MSLREMRAEVLLLSELIVFIHFNTVCFRMLNQCSCNDLTLYLSGFEKPKQKTKNKNSVVLCAVAYFILLSMEVNNAFSTCVFY